VEIREQEEEKENSKKEVKTGRRKGVRGNEKEADQEGSCLC
jgi:hypothetical protein